MTRQFFIFLFQAIFVEILDQIDTAFGNNINIDSIVVLSTFTVITWIIHHIAQIGTYTYRMWQDRVRTCETVSLVMSIITGGVIFFTSDGVVRLWHLTEYQYSLCSVCLKVYAVGLPIIQLGDFIDTYLLLKSKMKELIISDVLFYACLILTDLWCVMNHKPLPWLIACTVISYVVFDICIFIISGIRHEKEPVRWEDVKQCIKHGSNILFDKLMGKIATIYYGVMASGLGTELYAIHSVCYAVCVFGEGFTNAFNSFQIVRQKMVAKTRRYTLKKLLTKKYGWILTTLYIISVLPITYILKGDVPFLCVIGWVWVYCSDHFSLLFYEGNKAYLEAQEASRYLKYGGLVGGITRILWVFVLTTLGMGLLPFATACTVDFGIRAVYYGCAAKQVERKMKGEGHYDCKVKRQVKSHGT